jgi:hypothetical protein
VRKESVTAYRSHELRLIASRGLVSAIATRNLVVGHGTADTPAGGLENGKSQASERLEE